MDFEFYINKNILLSQFDLVKLWNVAEFQYWLWESAEDSGDIAYIRITDIDEFGVLKRNNMKYLREKSSFSDSILKKWDILVARTWATYGKTLYFNEDFRATYGGFLIRIKLDESKILPKYYFYFTHTNFYWNNAKKLVWWGWQPQFNANAVRQLDIPLPPLPIQQEIVELMNGAIAEKQKLEIEAEKMMAGIDDWLLGELGIGKLGNKGAKVSCIDIEKLIGGRIDAEFNLNSLVWVSSESFKRLGDLATLKAWWTPSRREKIYWEWGNIPWVKSWELKDNLNIQDVGECITEAWLKSSSAKLFSQWTLLIAMYWATAGEVGILWREATTNQAVCSVIPKDKTALNTYLFWALFLLRKKIKQDASGWAQPNISKEYLENLQIPLPPLPEQERIAKHISDIIARACAMRDQATRVYEDARAEVERRIIW